MLELVVKQGVNATPMYQVAKESNVAIGTIYNYFKDKEDILCQIYKMIREDFGTILILKEENQNPEDVFKKYWVDLFHYYVSNPYAFHFYEHIAKAPIIPLELIEETKIHYRPHAAFFWKGIKEGFLKDMHITLLVQIAYSNVVAAVHLKLNGVLPMTDIQIEQASNASWDAVRQIKE